MRLTELDPNFLHYAPDATRCFVDQLARANGVIFLCPVCQGSKAHYILCWTAAVPQTEAPHGGRWTLSGSSLADLTISPSVALVDGCRAHFWVQDGLVRMC